MSDQSITLVLTQYPPQIAVDIMQATPQQLAEVTPFYVMLNQGIQGTQGTSIQGVQGIGGSSQGTQGTSIQGSQGTSIQGIQGTLNAQGTQGTSIQGLGGSQGTQGTSVQGTQGTSVQGVQGTSVQGLGGIQGTQGTSVQGLGGSQGSQGASVQGTQGASVQGVQGTLNAQGTQGTSVQGVQGTSVQGLGGIQGTQGMSVQGTQGTSVQGVQGALNAQGAQGTSVQGTQGTSVQGTQGTSIQGTQGTSVQGTQGASVQGVQGTSIQGTQGTQGTPIQGTAGVVTGQILYFDSEDSDLITPTITANSTIAFVTASTPDTMTIGGGYDLVAAGFKAGMKIAVSGGTNDGRTYVILSVATGTLTFIRSTAVVNEAAGTPISISINREKLTRTPVSGVQTIEDILVYSNSPEDTVGATLDWYTTTNLFPVSTTLPAGEWEFHFWAYTSSQASASYIHFEAYKVTPLGICTLLFTTVANKTTITSAIGSTNNQKYFVQLYTVNSDISLDTTDRISIRVVATVASSDRTVSWIYQGTAMASHIITSFFVNPPAGAQGTQGTSVQGTQGTQGLLNAQGTQGTAVQGSTGTPSVFTTATLTVVGWNGGTYQQTVAVIGVTGSNNVGVFPPSARADYLAYGLAQISCIAQGIDTLTFQCTTIPTVQLVANVEIK